MESERKTPDATDPPIERMLGRYGNANEGPLVIAVAGLHGNEHAGVIAARRVLGALSSRAPAAHGSFLALAGNLEALTCNQRFVDKDLNRMWIRDDVARTRSNPGADSGVEYNELRELLDAIEAALHEQCGPVVLVDLHSTSAEAVPFCIMSDTLANRGIAFSLGVPVILGLEESITGTIQGYFSDRGFVTFAVEGGQHTNPATSDRLESALWVILHAAGVLDAGGVPDLGRHRSRLRDVSDGLPDVVEVFFRHGLAPGDEFRMRGGFRNFSPVNRGELVASDRRGDILAPEDGLLILPSYQGRGDDGFFIGRHVRHFWLSLSAGLRRMHVDRLLHWLPGVHRDPADPGILYADPHVTRWLTSQVFHLAGYRKCDSINGLLVFRRRVEA